ncbi:MAG: tetratricopeptide repeat protein [Cytophagales bacterium]|nr:tetratricopeptide repeat protein [Cytophagales bacterium]
MKKTASIFLLFTFYFLLFNDLSSAQDADTTLANMSYDSIQKEEAIKNADYYISKGDSFYYKSPDSAIFYYEKASVVYEKLNDWKSFVQCYLYLGDFYRIKWENKTAMNYLNNALETVKNKLGNDYELIAHIYNAIGSVYSNINNYNKALEFFKRSLSINIKYLGEQNMYTAANYNNIGTIYFYQGDYGRALDFFEKALRIRIKEVGQWHGSVGASYNNIAEVYSKTGDLKKALEYNEKALSIRLKVLGKNNMYVAYSYFNLGIVYLNMGEYDKALEFHNKSLAIDIMNFGNEHFNVAWDNLYIANVYVAKGAVRHRVSKFLTPTKEARNEFFTKALYLYNKSLKIMLKTVGQNHSLVSETYCGFGNLYLKQNDFNKALYYYQRSIISLLIRFNEKCIYINPVLKMSSKKKSDIISKVHLLDALVYKAETFEKLYDSGDKEIKEIGE